jgi:hypothetical protein
LRLGKVGRSPAQEHPQIAPLAKKEKQQEWQWVQKRFEKLHVHRKHPSG